LPVSVRAHEHIHQRLFLRQLLFEVLRHAAEHPDDQRALFLHRLQLGEMAIDLVMRILTDGTGVHEHDIGALAIFGKLESRFAE